MRTKAAPRTRSATPDSYFTCVRNFPLASIRSRTQLVAAQRVMDQLLAQAKLDAGESLYLDALSDLVGSYEDEHEPIPAASDADLLRHLLDARGLTQVALSRDTGLPKSTISEVLSGRRGFSRQMIRTLASYFEIDVTLLTRNL